MFQVFVDGYQCDYEVCQEYVQWYVVVCVVEWVFGMQYQLLYVFEQGEGEQFGQYWCYYLIGDDWVDCVLVYCVY